LKSRTLYLILFLFGLFLELRILSIAKRWPDYHTSPVLWFLGGFLTVFAGAKLLFFEKNEPATNENQTKKTVWLLGLFSILAAAVAFLLTPNFAAHPSNPLESDVIPTIEILVRRILNGEWVYAPIQFPTWTVNNAYLPMQYLPFIFAEKLHFDYRWLAYLSFLIIILMWINFSFKKQINLFEWTLKICFVFIALLMLNKHDFASFAFSLELIDVAFYLFLALSFYHKSWWFKGLAILFCLLSRYAFVIWLPFYVWSFFGQKGQKETLKVAGFVFFGVVLLYVLPFLTKEPMLFFNGLKYYDKTAIGQWSDIPDWYDLKKPFHLTQGLSTSVYFYDYWQGTILEKLAAARKLHFAACFLSVGLIAVFYWFYRKKSSFNYENFLLLSLKFYFIFFYGFFYVPFSYLYWIPLFYSVAILFKINFAVPRGSASDFFVPRSSASDFFVPRSSASDV
jgi:hypothetical protein